MAPKKKGKKEPELQEPEHDPSWERSVQSGVWERAVTALPGGPCECTRRGAPAAQRVVAALALARGQTSRATLRCVLAASARMAFLDDLRAFTRSPRPPHCADANAWPTWGALRERVLASCREVRTRARPGAAHGQAPRTAGRRRSPHA